VLGRGARDRREEGQRHGADGHAEELSVGGLTRVCLTGLGLSCEGPGPGDDGSTEFAGPRSRGAWAAVSTTSMP
jgi:hypothetical protein